MATTAEETAICFKIPKLEFEPKKLFTTGAKDINLPVSQRKAAPSNQHFMDNLQQVLSHMRDGEEDFGQAGNEFVEELMKLGVSMQDLSALTAEDLKLLGVHEESQRQFLLEEFGQIPCSLPTYQQILHYTDAKRYNEEILKEVTNELAHMKTVLALANYQMKYATVDDMLLGDKYYASHFAKEALNELEQEANRTKHLLQRLEVLTTENQRKKLLKQRLKYGTWYFMGLTALGVLAFTIVRFLRK